VLGKGRELEGVYDRLGDEDCSDEFTDEAFKGFDDEIKLHCIKRVIIALIVVLVIIAYNFLI
jgi:hypothetical protein